MFFAFKGNTTMYMIFSRILMTNVQKCKITTTMDRNCGNESKIRLMSKNPLLYAPIFTFQINDQKTREFREPSDKSQKHSIGLN
jgi:hypothetical protein